MKRNNFSRPVINEIVDRATDSAGNIVCEGCGLVLKGRAYQIDHTIAQALRDGRVKPKKLTAEDGKLLGLECCHKPKTKDDIGKIRKADRQKSAQNHSKRKKSPPLKNANNLKVEKKTPKIDKSALPALKPRSLFQ
jgi:transcription initiation factor TFIIIB Brf1 subunit/transcription initiation factor TFIIB